MAEWLEAALSVEISEYGFARIECPDYAEMIWGVKRRANASLASPKHPDEPENRLHVFGRRWASGEAIAGLAKEARMSWNRLWSELNNRRLRRIEEARFYRWKALNHLPPLRINQQE